MKWITPFLLLISIQGFAVESTRTYAEELFCQLDLDLSRFLACKQEHLTASEKFLKEEGLWKKKMKENKDLKRNIVKQRNKFLAFRECLAEIISLDEEDRPRAELEITEWYVNFLRETLSLPSNWTEKVDDFPKALIVDQKPVHPECVLCTQFGDSSRFEPMPVNYSKREDGYIQITNEQLEYRIKDHIVTHTYDFKYDIEGCTRSFFSEVSYRAWHVTDDCALVLVDHHSTDGTGRFTELGLVKREGDFLLNAGEIAGGDRCHGTIMVDFFRDDIVQFSAFSTPLDIAETLCKLFELNLPVQNDLPGSPIDYGGKLIWQVRIQGENVSEPQLVGIHFPDFTYEIK